MKAFSFKIYLLSILLSCATLAQGQSTVTSCKTDQVNDDLFNSDKALKLARKATEDQINSIIQANKFAKPSGTIYIIPVVVHVIHTGQAIGSGANISLAQIQSQIDALTRDFRRLPDDGGIAQGAGVDTEIQFCLKAVNRVDGSSVSGYSTSGITSSNEVSVKALSLYDNCCYYNIWTVTEIDGNNGGAGTQGYAYFPNNCSYNKDKDGTVILYNAFGNDPGGGNGYNLKTYTQLGRVMTHEMGHGLDLYHTFGGGSCTETDCNTDGDRCCDTPPHPGNNTNCGTPECSGTQPVNNYLDYTGEVCQNMFTLDQANRMRAACAGPRAGLFALACACPPLLPVDAGVIAILGPVGSDCGDSLCPQVILKNFGSDPLTSVTINYQVDVTNYTYAWTGTLAPNYTDTIDLPCVAVGVGAHTFTSWTSLPNGVTDGDLNNDSSSSTFNTVAGSAVTLTITTDNFGYETYWEVTDCGSTVYGSGGNPLAPPGGQNQTASTNSPAYAGSTTYNEQICLVDSCYCFTIYDDFGDGMCCTSGSGSFLLQDQFGNTLASGGAFSSIQTTNFCVTSILPVAIYSADNTVVCEGTTVNYTDMSTGNVISWAWTFAGGIPATSSEQNPSVVYNTAGIYDVTLIATNSIGEDTLISTSYITVNANPTVTMVGGNVNCACNGTASATPLTGLAPFTYSWNDPALQTTTSISALCAGTYTLTLTDANGCVVQGLASVVETSSYSTAITASSNVTCNGAGDGSATVTVSGGITPYTYAWSNLATTSSVSSLTPATYSVTVTDANNCTSIETVTITEPAVLGVTATSTNSGCFRSCFGTGTASPSGGTMPYTYLWDDIDLQNSVTALSLCAGSFNVLVTDSSGCTATTGITVTELPEIILAMDSTDATCGASDGTATVTASGGTGSTYSYFWNVVPLQTTATATGLAAGSYTVMVTDSVGCSQLENVSVNSTGGPVATITASSDPLCSTTCSGSATASVSGGVSPLTYLWSDAANQTTAIATGLCGLNYTVKVTDSNGCVTTASVELTSPPSLNIAITDSNDVSCNGVCDGSATVSAVGGTGAYTYSWSNSQTTSTATVLCAASYTVSVTDNNGCVMSAPVTIEQPPPLTATTTGTVTPCPCPCAGVVRVFPAGGTPPYNVIWSSGETDKYLSKLCDGTYGVTVTDANGCIVIGTSVTITN
ncbi:MAG: hypothetical protein COB85_02375 [Bacteroidetes bacterium]|nr:MAG: hypothetical protein COB85_02375 [Bacteroidota bacterium]